MSKNYLVYFTLDQSLKTCADTPEEACENVIKRIDMLVVHEEIYNLMAREIRPRHEAEDPK